MYFNLDYDYNGYLPGIKNQIIDIAINGRGIQDTARVLKMSPTTVMTD
jgi:transposase-like protein